MGTWGNGNALWVGDNYNAPVRYLFDKRICEYDIRKANISILLDAGVIDQETYNRLYEADRMVRQYEIGMLQKNKPEVKQILSDGFKEARHQLFNKLELDETCVLHVIKDAVFVMKPIVGGGYLPDKVQVSPHVEFIKKSESNSYLNIGRGINIYYGFDIPTGVDKLKIRGMSDECVKLHEDYFIHMLKTILKVRATSGNKLAYDICKSSFSTLMDSSPDVAKFKRRFDAQSRFDIRPMSSFSSFQADYLTKQTECIIDGSYNMSILANIGNVLLADSITNRG